MKKTTVTCDYCHEEITGGMIEISYIGYFGKEPRITADCCGVNCLKHFMMNQDEGNKNAISMVFSNNDRK